MFPQEEEKRIRAAKKIHEKARYMRGRFLNSVAVIEHKISLILTEYFCSHDEGKRKIFFNKIMNAHFFSLNAKRDILIEIVKKDYPLYWKENQAELKDLKTIIEFRNKLAHSIVDVSAAALARPIEEGIGFIEWNKGQVINDDEFQNWDVRTNMVSSCLEDIKHLLPFKQRPPS